MKIGDLKQVDKELKLGMLKGNWFSIAIRFIQATKEIVEKNVLNITEKGFINYFGLQWFGTYTIKTHEIGWFVLREDYEQVCWMIIESASSPDDIDRKKQIGELIFEKNEILKAKELLTFRDWIEEKVVDYLFDQPNAYKNAFEKLSWNTRIIYVHAY